MAFEIVVVADVEYKMGNEAFVIPRAFIIPGEMKLLSKPAFKEDVTTYHTIFRVNTNHGLFEWGVEYFVGMDVHGIESVSLLNHPVGVTHVGDFRVETIESAKDNVFDDFE